jgi:ABC-type glycerol-3-phosphate transport system substrate-binding protein
MTRTRMVLVSGLLLALALAVAACGGGGGKGSGVASLGGADQATSTTNASGSDGYDLELTRFPGQPDSWRQRRPREVRDGTHLPSRVPP